MSALGQKRTCAAQNVMSALLSIATAKADSCKRPCPLYPRKRTWAVQLGMSALCQKRTSRANHSIISSARACIAAGTVRPSALAVFRLMLATRLWWPAGPVGLLGFLALENPAGYRMPASRYAAVGNPRRSSADLRPRRTRACGRSPGTACADRDARASLLRQSGSWKLPSGPITSPPARTASLLRDCRCRKLRQLRCVAFKIMRARQPRDVRAAARTSFVYVSARVASNAWIDAAGL